MRELIARMVAAYESGQVSRRDFIGTLSALAATGALPAPAEAAAPFQAVGPNHVALRVTDVARSRDFYSGLLGIPPVRNDARSCFLDMRTGFLALFQNDQPGMDHYCLAVENYDVHRAERQLKEAGLNPRVTGERIYFQDPDDLTVQLSGWEHKP